MKKIFHCGAGEDKCEAVLLLGLLGGLEPRGGAFFSSDDPLLRLGEIALRLVEAPSSPAVIGSFA